MKKLKKLNFFKIFEYIILSITIILAIIFFDWKLGLIVFLTVCSAIVSQKNARENVTFYNYNDDNIKYGGLSLDD